MKPEAQRIAIAEACGWSDFNSAAHEGAIQYGKRPLSCFDSWELPDYLTDLNAMHEAEKVLNGLNYHEYMRQVEKSVDPLRQCHESQAVFRFLRSTAAQRAEAFLKTLNLFRK